VTLEVFDLPAEFASRDLAPVISCTSFGQDSVIHHDQKLVRVDGSADG
jgi:hypothetical protein